MKITEAISKYRIFPRLFTIGFFWMCIEVFRWFMALPEPNNAQAGFVMTLAGGLVYAMKAYSDNGIKVKIAKENNKYAIKQKEIDVGIITQEDYEEFE